MTDRKIMICTGHYKSERGARNWFLGVSEWQMCSIVNRALYDHLSLLDYEVMILDDTILTKKVTVINNLYFDLVLELHMNAYNEEQQGHLCMCWYTSPSGLIFAENVSNFLTHNIRRNTISVSKRNEKGSFFLRKTKYPAIIIELCFIDNNNDLYDTMINVRQVVRQIGRGIDNAFIVRHKLIT